jgi:hypothetical protein
VTEQLLKAVIHSQDWAFLELAACRLGPSPPFAFFIWVVQEVRSGRLGLVEIEKTYALLFFWDGSTLANGFGACWLPPSPPRPAPRESSSPVYFSLFDH